ncbi:MAG: class I SAM-dependent methyltransferase [Pseudonocardia sp.]
MAADPGSDQQSPSDPAGRAPILQCRPVDPRAARRTFLVAAMRRPATVGAVAPSSTRLAGVLASVVPSEGSPIVVELGPGTGSVSAAIDRRLPAGARHLAIELDTGMVEYLHRTRPLLEVVRGDARHLGALLAEHGVTRVDAVVSGLPWALFDAPTQTAILREVTRLIGPTGAFATFAYLHGMPLNSARRFRHTLREIFDEVVVGTTIWRNLPPAFGYICRRPAGVPVSG